jgi:predicted DNA-binding transcriptional regulator AlpA
MTIDLQQELAAAMRALMPELEAIVRAAVRAELAANRANGDPARLAGVSEAAMLLGVTEAALRRRVERGRFPVRVTRLGRSLRFLYAEIVALAEPPLAKLVAAARSPTTPKPPLSGVRLRRT